MTAEYKRVVIIVLDGVGCGEAPDAAEFGDSGSNTLGHVSEKASSLNLPTLSRWGIGNLTHLKTVSPMEVSQCVASFGKAREMSRGKDTTSGHWEMAGVIVEKPFPTYSKGFPQDQIDRWIKANNLPGILGNKAASGTEIIKELGEEHLKTGKPILYTSADSVWQVAAHEEHFGLERLYEICKSAREICNDLNISRVIARPFVGTNAKDFVRTHHRKDYSQHPPSKTMMEILNEKGFATLGIGKISNIFQGAGIQKNIDTKDNKDGMAQTLKILDEFKTGLIFVNLIDFDMLYGHRRDIQGFAKSLEEFDLELDRLEKKLTPQDLVIITADHGNDPAYPGTDHTREYVPMLCYSPSKPSRDLGIRTSFADVGQTTLHALTGDENILDVGRSFLEKK